MPGKFYFAKLKYHDNQTLTENTIIGATIIGVPAVIIGRNRNISWGITKNNHKAINITLMENINPTTLKNNKEIIKTKNEILTL